MQTVNGIRIFGGNKFPESYPKRRVSRPAPVEDGVRRCPRRRRAKRGLFEKAPFKSRKNFPALTPYIGCAYPKRRASLLAAPQVPPPQAAAGNRDYSVSRSAMIP